jgi:hypothetical protein
VARLRKCHKLLPQLARHAQSCDDWHLGELAHFCKLTWLLVCAAGSISGRRHHKHGCDILPGAVAARAACGATSSAPACSCLVAAQRSRRQRHGRRPCWRQAHRRLRCIAAGRAAKPGRFGHARTRVLQAGQRRAQRRAARAATCVPHCSAPHITKRNGGVVSLTAFDDRVYPDVAQLLPQVPELHTLRVQEVSAMSSLLSRSNVVPAVPQIGGTSRRCSTCELCT